MNTETPTEIIGMIIAATLVMTIVYFGLEKMGVF